jgi:hypothetical protein
MNIDREFSMAFDESLATEDKNTIALVDLIWEKVLAPVFPEPTGRGKRPVPSVKEQCMLLVLNLWHVWTVNPGKSVYIPMSKGRPYGRFERITAVMIDIVTKLKEHRVIGFCKGDQSARRQSRVLAASRLTQYFEAAPPLELAWRDPIVLQIKNEDGSRERLAFGDLDYKPISAMRESVEAYQALLDNSCIDIANADNRYIQRQKWNRKAHREEAYTVQITGNNRVERIFYRGDWNLGGRFHGGFWQSVGKHYRKNILIDDCETVEQDYSSLHVNLCYGLIQQAPPKGDLYVVGLKSVQGMKIERNWVKTLTLMAINAPSEHKAYKSFRNSFKRGSFGKKLTNKSLKEMMISIKERHSGIEQFFFSDKGVELMRIDGEITAYVVDHFTSKDVPILTVHDSYIAKRENEGELREVMKVAAEKIAGSTIPTDVQFIHQSQIVSFQAHDRFQPYIYEMYKKVVKVERCQGYRERLGGFKVWEMKKGAGTTTVDCL